MVLGRYEKGLLAGSGRPCRNWTSKRLICRRTHREEIALKYSINHVDPTWRSKHNEDLTARCVFPIKLYATITCWIGWINTICNQQVRQKNARIKGEINGHKSQACRPCPAGKLMKFYSPRRQHTIITMTINEHAKTDMYIEHYIKYWK